MKPKETTLLNKVIEVTEQKYELMKVMFAGLVAHKKENGKFYIKPLLYMGQKKRIMEMLEL